MIPVKPTVYILCGVPGCGKSYFAKNFVNSNRAWVSRDFFRFHLISDQEDYFSHEKETFKAYTDEIIKQLKNGMDVIADATHLNFRSRKKLTDAIDKEYKDYNIIYVVFDVPMDVILKQNAQREGRARVPENAIYRMNASYHKPFEEDKRAIACWTIEYGGKI
jgi:predicted kinase